MITDPALLKTALVCQKNEITEYRIYTKLAELCPNDHNARILRSLAQDERRHSLFWESHTGRKMAPGAFKAFGTVLLARALGLTFVLKQMEKNESVAAKKYQMLIEAYPEIEKISADEDAHEQALLACLDEELLRYTGSVVLGLNDALVELTGALAGFTLALGETKMISIAGLITGVSAAFSMAASEYLSAKADGDSKAATSSLYTGGAYFITVVLLILPFLIVPNKFHALAITLAVAVFIIFLFNYYLSVAKNLSFKKRFAEMAAISLGVAGLSFGVGWLLNRLMGV
ncbi:MAG: VIT1/CCC1 transporter family protein [Treponema sp.]|jgi:VIT1/CCC1 family predicted Fe2+/Mn2+ transporter|nr:VIT1/CCC1 transporter family protein [Treponema sp.]